MKSVRQMLEEVNAKTDRILAAVCPECATTIEAEPVKKPWTTPFGEPGQTGGGQVFPEPKPVSDWGNWNIFPAAGATYPDVDLEEGQAFLYHSETGERIIVTKCDPCPLGGCSK